MYDRKVLRFYGYFQEHVVEDKIENFRVRRVVLLYHLDDDTIFINEPKIENSGILQGKFVKRHGAPKSDGSGNYHWKDLAVQTNVEMYGKVFRIVDADEFTRAFYQDQGVQLAEAEAFPEDNFSKGRLLLEFKMNPPEMGEIKEYRETQLGGGHPNRGLQQFLENDRNVLSFDIF